MFYFSLWFSVFVFPSSLSCGFPKQVDFSKEIDTKSSNSDYEFVKPFQKNDNSFLSTSLLSISHFYKNNTQNITDTNTTCTSSSLYAIPASLTSVPSLHSNFVNSKSSSNNDYEQSTTTTTFDPAKIFYEEVLSKQEKAAAQARLYNIAKRSSSFGFVDQFTDFVMNNNEFVGVNLLFLFLYLFRFWFNIFLQIIF